MKPTRILVHMGFYKTGTTSIQHYLNENREVLKSYADFYLPGDMITTAVAARRYATMPSLISYFRFRRALRSFLDQVGDAPLIFISREQFCGLMPGHKRFGLWMAQRMRPYSAHLARAMVSELHHRFGDDAQIELIYTTRERDIWIESLWGHILRSIDLKLDLASFRKKMRKLPSPDDETAYIAQKIQNAQVTGISLETHSMHRLGTIGVILEKLDVPRDVIGTLPDAPIKNQGNTGELRDEMLALNRSISDPVELKNRKEALVRESR